MYMHALVSRVCWTTLQSEIAETTSPTLMAPSIILPGHRQQRRHGAAAALGAHFHPHILTHITGQGKIIVLHICQFCLVHFVCPVYHLSVR